MSRNPLDAALIDDSGCTFEVLPEEEMQAGIIEQQRLSPNAFLCFFLFFDGFFFLNGNLREGNKYSTDIESWSSVTALSFFMRFFGNWDRSK